MIMRGNSIQSNDDNAFMNQRKDDCHWPAAKPRLPDAFHWSIPPSPSPVTPPHPPLKTGFHFPPSNGNSNINFAVVTMQRILKNLCTSRASHPGARQWRIRHPPPTGLWRSQRHLWVESERIPEESPKHPQASPSISKIPHGILGGVVKGWGFFGGGGRGFLRCQDS